MKSTLENSPATWKKSGRSVSVIFTSITLVAHGGPFGAVSSTGVSWAYQVSEFSSRCVSSGGVPPSCWLKPAASSPE